MEMFLPEQPLELVMHLEPFHLGLLENESGWMLILEVFYGQG